MKIVRFLGYLAAFVVALACGWIGLNMVGAIVYMQANPPPPRTAAPTPTPDPRLSVYEIENNFRQLTELQWDEYAAGLVGEEISFRGTATEVYKDGTIMLNTGRRFTTRLRLEGVPTSVAFSIHKNSVIRGYGTIRAVRTSFGLSVVVDVEEIQL